MSGTTHGDLMAASREGAKRDPLVYSETLAFAEYGGRDVVVTACAWPDKRTMATRGVTFEWCVRYRNAGADDVVNAETLRASALERLFVLRNLFDRWMDRDSALPWPGCAP